MARGPTAGGPDLQRVLTALDDADCRHIVEELNDPMTASEVAETCEIPMSTTYRKLELLSEAELLAEGTEIRPDGHHATLYERDFEEICVGLDDDRLAVEVERPARTADERLANIWSEVRKET